MKRINKKITMTLLAGAAMALVTGCGGGSSATIPENEAKEMTQQQAQNAMALHAAMYPAFASVTDCLTSVDAAKQCLENWFGDNGASSTVALLAPGKYSCTKGDDGYVHGYFDYNRTDDGTMIYTFSDNCADYGNNKDLFENLILKSCLLGTRPRIEEGDSPVDGTYRVEHRGSITCSPGKKFGDYMYRTIGNSNDKTKMEWRYSGTLAFDSGNVSLNGYVRGIAKYAVGDDNASTPWDELFLGSDEEWQFENVTIGLGDKLVLNGKGTYIKRPNDNDGEQGKGYEFYLAFDALTYDFTNESGDITSTVKGKVKATCQPTWVIYNTKTDMVDVSSLPDAKGQRMPSSGAMTAAIEGHTPADVTYQAAGSNAEVKVGTQVFNSWHAIIAESSCKQINDFLDSI